MSNPSPTGVTGLLNFRRSFDSAVSSVGTSILWPEGDHPEATTSDNTVCAMVPQSASSQQPIRPPTDKDETHLERMAASRPAAQYQSPDSGSNTRPAFSSPRVPVDGGARWSAIQWIIWMHRRGDRGHNGGHVEQFQLGSVSAAAPAAHRLYQPDHPD